MADGYFQSVMNWLKGPQPTPSLGLEQAPPLPAYPSQADADYARHFGFGNNNINEDFLNNNKARVLGINFEDIARRQGQQPRTMFVPLSGAGKTGENVMADVSSSVVDLNNNKPLQGDLRNVMMQAALASNRSPIAAMGFDPSRVVMDNEIKEPSVGGLFRTKEDRMYVPTAMADSIVHESTHRGIQKLREQYPEQVKEIAGSIGPKTDEMLVRWLMHSRAGDPEGFGGAVDASQRQQAIDMFGANKQNQEIVRQLEELAIKDRLTRSRRSGPQ